MNGDLLTQLSELVALPAIAGRESSVAAWIAQRLERGDLHPTVDRLGNLVLAPSKARPRVLVCAHMDQVGFIVSRIESDHARCLAVGDAQPAVQAGEPVRIGRSEGAGFAGVIERQEDDGVILRTDDLAHVRVGDAVVFNGPLVPGERNLARAAALDNRVGCLIVLAAALTAGPGQGDVAFAWTVREETEQSGVIGVARALQPEAVVAVDVTPATGRDEHYESVISCGGGPVITLLDEGLVADEMLLGWFAATAARLDLHWQPEVVGSGVSEAGQVLQVLGIPSLALLVAVEGMHSSAETVDLEDIAGAIRLLAGALDGSGGLMQGA